MDKLIIIPDIHGQSFWREPVELYPEARFIFLGDYLDPYPSDMIQEQDSFQGLKEIVIFKRLNPERVTLLWGNHDLHYLSYDIVKGSRFDYKNAERNHHFFQENQSLFQIAHEEMIKSQRYVFSHAGIGRLWIKKYTSLPDNDITAEWLNKCMGSPDFYSALNEVSLERGGKELFGSMIWADAKEQLSTANVMMSVTQIFGHTCLSQPMNIQNRIYCLDCTRAFYLNMHDGMVYDLATDNIIEEMG